MTTWILVANSSDAKIYSCENVRTDNVHFEKEFLHPNSRKKTGEILADKSGNFRNSVGIAGDAYETKVTPKQMEAEYFAEELAKEIVRDYNAKKFADLILIMPAHFHALLIKHLHAHFKEKLFIPKDYTKFTISDLSAALKNHL